VLLRTPFFWGVTQHHWVSGALPFQRTFYLLSYRFKNRRKYIFTGVEFLKVGEEKSASGSYPRRRQSISHHIIRLHATELRSVISQETAIHITSHYSSARHWATTGVSLSDWKLWPLQSANDTTLGYLNGTVTHHSILYRCLWPSHSAGYTQWGSRSTDIQKQWHNRHLC
jgi:hypothetical protein